MADHIDVGLAEMYPGVCNHMCCSLDHCMIKEKADDEQRDNPSQLS